MSETRTDQDRLLDEAIDLIIRYQNDPDNPVTSEMIHTWRARGPQNEQAWSRVAQIHGVSGKILIEKRNIERGESLGLTRRQLALGGLGLIGAGAAAYSLGPSLLLKTRADYITAEGEIRQIRLPDGSSVTLGPESAIALDFSGQRRTIDLLSGMSFFDVVHDPTRPFSAMSGPFRAAAAGATFDMSSDAGVLSVSVEHGDVELRGAREASDPIASLSPREWITIDPSSGDIDRGLREAGQVASWRDKLLIAERETVSALSARIGRWMSSHIIIADPSIGRQRVSGVFDLNNPLLALQAVVHPVGAHVRQITPFVTLVSSV